MGREMVGSRMGAAPRLLGRATVLAASALLAFGGLGATPAQAQSPSPEPSVAVVPSGSPLAIDLEQVLIPIDVTVPAEQAVAGAEAALLDLLIEQSGLARALDPEALAMVRALLGATAAPEQDGASRGLMAAVGFGDAPVPATADLALAGATNVGAMIGAMAGMQGAIDLGYERDGATDSGPATLQGTTESDGVRTAASTSTSVRVSKTGSKVVVDAISTLTGTQTTIATGARVGVFRQQTQIHAEIDGCPDADGVAEMKLSGEATMDASGMPGGGGLTMALDQTRRGHVGEDAYLRSVDDSYDLGVELAPPGGGSTRSVAMNGSLSHGRTPSGSMDPATFTGRGTIEDNPGGFTEADILGYYRAISLLLIFVAETGYDRAQAKWRDGACVRIESTEPRNRTVEPSEQVAISAKPMHRIDGSELEKPVVGSLAGEGELDPADTPQQAPAQLSYKAADEEGKTGTVTLTSTSNRGIGTLVTSFRVDPGRYELKATGRFTVKGLIPMMDFKGTISATVRDIRPGAGDEAGEGTTRVEVELVFNDPRLSRTCKLRAEAVTGTAVVQSPRSAPEERTVRVRLDLRDQMSRMRANCAGRTLMVELEDEGGLGHFWSETIPEIAFPRDGGRKRVSGTKSFPAGWTVEASGTVTLRKQRT